MCSVLLWKAVPRLFTHTHTHTHTHPHTHTPNHSGVYADIHMANGGFSH